MKRKIIIECQKDVKDCGPCCLSSIIKFYDGYVPLEKIRMDTFTSYEGVSAYHILKAAEKYGFDGFVKKSNNKNLSEIILPAIVHVIYKNGLTHFMCLYEIKGNNYILMDPSKGKIKMAKSAFDEIFSGVFIELFPKNKIILLEKSNSIYNLFFKIILDNKKLCINTLLCSILLTVFTISSGFYYKIINEMLANNYYENKIKLIIFLFLILMLLKVVFNYFKSYYENHINKNIDISIYDNYITHLFNLPFNVISSRTTGEIMTRINELSSIKNLFSEIFISCFLDLFIAFTAFCVLCFINIRLTIILCIFMLIYILFSLMVNPYLYKRIRKNIDYQTEFNSTLIENINMMCSIKNLDKTKPVLNHIEEKNSNLIFDNYRFLNFINFIQFIQSFILENAEFIITATGVYLIIKNNYSLLSLITFNMIMSYFKEPIKRFVDLFPKYNFFRASFRKVCDFVDIKQEYLGKLEDFQSGDIKINNVSFSYNDFNLILDDYSLVIKQNEKVMIKGQSGKGKSTLCKLLNRSLELNNGSILIGEKNINDYSLKTIRNNIIYVGQKEFLYTDTIKNNIMFYNDDLEKFDKVCKICLIDEIVEKRKFRYDFGVCNDSSNISGGEKQRIILARGLMNNFEVLILDEALSETDYEMEAKIIKNILKSYPDKTILYISHKKQDNLFERVIEIGGKNELL